MADYEEQKLKLTDKKEAYQKKLRSLMEEIEIEEEALQDTANEIPTSTLDEVWYTYNYVGNQTPM